MTRRLATSDLHFGHSNILKFTNRYNSMKADGVNLPEELMVRYFNGEAKTEEIRMIVKEHDAWLIDKLNKQINDGDHIWHLGDFCFKHDVEVLHCIFSRLKGTWHFILGNHDNEAKIRQALVGTRHILVGYYDEININNTKVCLLHYPMEEWNKAHNKHCPSWHLHGHLHGSKGHGDFILKDMPRRLDVGIDAHPYHLIFDMEEILKEVPL